MFLKEQNLHRTKDYTSRAGEWGVFRYTNEANQLSIPKDLPAPAFILGLLSFLLFGPVTTVPAQQSPPDINPNSEEIVVATEYGAVPDDGGDDRSAIQQALNSAGKNKTVFLPPGTFHLSGAVSIPDDTVFRGYSHEKTRLVYHGSKEGSFLKINGSRNVEVCCLTLDARKSKAAQQGIQASDARRVYLHDLIIENFVETSSFGPHGIYCSSDVKDSRIERCFIRNIAPGTKWGAGIRLNETSNTNTIVDNTIRKTGRGGILCEDSRNLVIRENRIEKSGLEGGTGLGIEVWGGCDRAMIEDNRIDHWLSVDNSDRTAVRRNEVGTKDGSYKLTGLELVGSSNCVFTDNTVKDGAAIGLSVSNDDPKHHVFWGRNEFSLCSTWGAQVQGDKGEANYMYFYRNVFAQTPPNHPAARYDDSGHGFRINGRSHFLVFEENVFRNNGNAGFQFVGSEIGPFRFTGNAFVNNGGSSLIGDPGDAIVWENNRVSGNGTNRTLSTRGVQNRKPEAKFSAPTSIRKGDKVKFRNKSTDPDGSIDRVLWDVDYGLPSTDRNPTVQYDESGIYRVTLIVWDNGGRSDLYEKEISVTTDRGNIAPTADARSNQIVTSDDDGDGSETVTLIGAGSSDSDGNITNYSWTKDGSEIATGESVDVSLSKGTHHLTLTVTDDRGTTDSDTITVSVRE